MFQFGNTYFLQLSGTAMGTSVACMYAYLYSGWKETTEILPMYNSHTKLKFHGRLIDDIFGIWLDGDGEKWQHYKDNLNDYQPGKLKWETSELSDTVNYLDLTINMKEYNLRLYVPKHSAHPKGTLKNLIIGSLGRYWKQNTKVEDFKKITSLLFQKIDCKRIRA